MTTKGFAYYPTYLVISIAQPWKGDFSIDYLDKSVLMLTAYGSLYAVVESIDRLAPTQSNRHASEHLNLFLFGDIIIMRLLDGVDQFSI